MKINSKKKVVITLSEHEFIEIEAILNSFLNDYSPDYPGEKIEHENVESACAFAASLIHEAGG